MTVAVGLSSPASAGTSSSVNGGTVSGKVVSVGRFKEYGDVFYNKDTYADGYSGITVYGASDGSQGWVYDRTGADSTEGSSNVDLKEGSVVCIQAGRGHYGDGYIYNTGSVNCSGVA